MPPKTKKEEGPSAGNKKKRKADGAVPPSLGRTMISNNKKAKTNTSTSTGTSIGTATSSTTIAAASAITKNKNSSSSSSSSSLPNKIGKKCTIAQLEEEAKARGLDLGNVIKHDKAFLLGVLGEGSLSVVAFNSNKSKNKTTKSTTATSTASTKSNKIAPAVAAKISAPSPSTSSKNQQSLHVSGNATKTDTETTKHAPPKLSTTTAKTSSSGNANVFASTATAKRKLTARKTAASTVKKAPASTKVSTHYFKKNLSSTSNTNASPLVGAGNPAPVKSMSMSTDKAKKAATSSKASVPALINKKPPAAAAAAVAPATGYPRISNKLTLAQLKGEATARQMDLKRIPKLIKAHLLHYLVDGSIHVMETKVYKDYQTLLTLVKNEQPLLYNESMIKQQAAVEKRRDMQQQRQEEEKRRQTEERKQKLQVRTEEMQDQVCHHVHSFPYVHRHPLAKTSALKSNGYPRHVRTHCDRCDNRRIFKEPNRPEYSCEQCDFDICMECFVADNKSIAEKQAARQKLLEEKRRQQRQRDEEERNRWDATRRFQKNIIRPPARNKNFAATKTANLKYTVWCSNDNDGLRPEKEFDTSWVTIEEANQRAEYLFFWKNPYGVDPNEVKDDNGEPKPSTKRDGMQQWTVSPPDSTWWTVGVVPIAAYPHLDNATQRRHFHDDERFYHSAY